MSHLPARLHRLASTHHGLLHRTALVHAGIGPARMRTLLERRILERLSRRVFRIPGAPLTDHQRLLAACWSLDGVVSHRSAAHLHGFSGFSPTDPPEVMVQEAAHRPTRLARLRTVSRLDPVDSVIVESIPTTSIPRTLLSLAGIAGLRKDGKEISRWSVEDAFDRALATGRTDEDAIADMLARNRRSGRAGVALIEELLDARRDGAITESHLERLTLELIRNAGLPEPVCQARIARRGTFVARVDFLYPDHDVIIEVSGHRWHRSAEQLDHDTRRRRELTALGYRVFEFTYRQINRSPGLLIDLIRSLHHHRAA